MLILLTAKTQRRATTHQLLASQNSKIVFVMSARCCRSSPSAPQQKSLKRLGPLVLPPLYHEAMNPTLKGDLLDRIQHCFPYLAGSTQRQQLETDLVVIELPKRDWPAPKANSIACFSVDTAVEEHGPHLPLATDTLQSYAVLDQLPKTLSGNSHRASIGIRTPHLGIAFWAEHRHHARLTNSIRCRIRRRPDELAPTSRPLCCRRPWLDRSPQRNPRRNPHQWL